MKMPCSATAMEVLTDAGTKSDRPQAKMSYEQAADWFMENGDVKTLLVKLMKLGHQRVPYGDVFNLRAVCNEAQQMGRDIWEDANEL